MDPRRGNYTNKLVPKPFWKVQVYIEKPCVNSTAPWHLSRGSAEVVGIGERVVIRVASVPGAGGFVRGKVDQCPEMASIPNGCFQESGENPQNGW